MVFFGRLPKSLIAFWLIQVAAVIVLWNFLPTPLTGDLMILLIAINSALLYLRQFELPIFSNVALILALAHFWMGNGFLSPVAASALIFVGIAITGLIAQSLDTRQTARGTDDQTPEIIGVMSRENLRAWFLIGLFTAEIASLAEFWPITYLQKSILCLAIFYLVWQLWQVIGAARKPIFLHFIFAGLAVMVVVANIVWTTWPGLKTF